jgi:flagellar basal-body rod protein FlgF
MINALAALEDAMRPKLTQLEIIANNLANVNTTGFKRDRSFLEVLQQTITNADGSATEDVEEIRQYTDFSQGSLNKTGNSLDVALKGRGFMVVETPNGMRYTRNGNFQLSTDGTVVTSEGFPVMGLNGRIQFPNVQRLQQGTISIAGSGEIMLDKETIGQLRVVDFEETGLLKKDHQSLFMADPNQRIVEGIGKETSIRQGYLEDSNVEGIEEMIAMIELTRSFEADQKALHAEDQSIEQSIQIAKV